MEGDSVGVFREVKFIADAQAERVVETLLSGGATQYESLASVPGGSHAHLITGDYNSPIALAAQSPPYSSRVVICTPAWIEASYSKRKIQDVRRYSPDPRQFFTGVCVTCSELPGGDKEAIYGGVLALGGQYSDALVKGTTHIVALTMNSDKVKAAVERPRAGVEIVLPHWFDDCLRLRRRIPVEPYRFPQPRILQTNLANAAPTPTSQEADFRHLCDSRLDTTPTPETQEDVFGGRSLFLGSDLDLGARLMTTISAVLGSANAILAKSIDKADIYVGKYRDGQQYVKAARSNKIVGNYTWIVYCLARGKFSSPRDHLLHYPIARDGHWDFRNDVITVSNYTGEPRLYLERLITALGAKFTRNMKPENTHLISASEHGEKYNIAKAWGISCVNHLWLEESYAKWQKQALTLHHYTTFPKETNLMDVIAQTPIQSEGLAAFLPEDETEDEVEPPSQVVQNAKDSKTSQGHVAAQNDVPDLEEESQDVELPDIKDVREFSSPLPSNKQATVSSNVSEKEQTPSATSERHEPAETTPRASDFATPLANRKSRKISEGLSTPIAQEQTPSSRGSTARKASQAAATKLRDNMEDANKFGQQMRNKHKLPPLPSEMPAAKRAKPTEKSLSPSTHRLTAVMTGCPELTEALHLAAEGLGIEFVEDATLASHLIAPRVARTKKFIVAIPKCRYFVNWKWLTDSVKARKLLAEDAYPIAAAPSAAWSKGLDLPQILERAKKTQSEGGLFDGYVVLVSEAVTKIGGLDTYREIVEANGGSCGMIGRRGVETKDSRVVMIADGKSDPVMQKLRPGNKGKENKDARQATKHEIYDREWLMMCAIRQTIDFDHKLRLS